MNIQELKKQSSEQLITQAEKLGIENASTLRKQDILFSILKRLAKNEVAIWHIRLEAGSHRKLPASRKGINRCLYFFQGDKLELMGTEVQSGFMIELDGSEEVELANGDQDSKLLMLQGKPIGEPVAQYGPFVMNSSDEIQQAFKDYQRTQFGGWPWEKSDPIHGRARGRFALHNDGNLEEPD